MALADENIDDMTIGLQMQQFLDEWNYRVVHASMAQDWDQVQTTKTAMSLFEAHGLVIPDEEKEVLAEMDENKMVEVLVRRMSPSLRKTFEHFTLQLQLFVSAAVRVRSALDEGEDSDVRRIIEEGDKAITMQILRQTVVEAASEISEIKQVHDSWSHSMNRRIDRLARTAKTTDEARDELEKINQSIDDFSRAQNEKSQKVLASMCGNNEKVLIKTCFAGWHNYHVKYQAEKDIHRKFRDEIEWAQAKLLEYQAAKLASVRRVMLQTLDNATQELKTEVVKQWAQVVKDEKEQAAAQKALEEQMAVMEGLKESQKENAKQSMLRMVQGNDSTLMSLCFQTWTSCMEEMRVENAYHKQTRDLENNMKSLKAQKAEENKGVMAKFSQGSDTGLVTMVFRAWSDDYKQDKRSREFQRQVNQSETLFKSMQTSQKAKAMGVSERVAQLEAETVMMSAFMNWQMETKLARVSRHYRQQMDDKKGQLDFVRTLFTDFANELGDVGNSPRTSKHKSSSKKDRSPERHTKESAGASAGATAALQ
mmetsp:Transcript_62076/g.156724  ORF Transcript_62076/g.156724 Transcript_62076/m.156724 type:complete len:537 (+) Transcript_62076:95-1705(+)